MRRQQADGRVHEEPCAPSSQEARLALVRQSVVLAATLVIALCVSVPSAQRAPVHLNPVVEKLAQGQPVFGVSTEDFSMANARGLARESIDFVRLEMEHAPMNFETVRNFLIGMIDKAALLKKGNAQPNVAPFVRIAPYGRDRADWVVKQALDVGVMGVKFPGVDTKEQALSAVQGMRYPQLRTSRYLEPAGLRGMGPTNAVWFWGIPQAEYLERADLWPLNPAGDLLCIVMIESAEGVKNVDEIASVPGVGLIFVGSAGDLPRSMGVAADSPDIERAVQTVLRACLANNVACGIPANADNIEQRVREGWKYLDLGRAGAGLRPSAEAALRVGRAAVR